MLGHLQCSPESQVRGLGYNCMDCCYLEEDLLFIASSDFIRFHTKEPHSFSGLVLWNVENFFPVVITVVILGIRGRVWVEGSVITMFINSPRLKWMSSVTRTFITTTSLRFQKLIELVPITSLTT